MLSKFLLSTSIGFAPLYFNAMLLLLHDKSKLQTLYTHHVSSLKHLAKISPEETSFVFLQLPKTPNPNSTCPYYVKPLPYKPVPHLYTSSKQNFLKSCLEKNAFPKISYTKCFMHSKIMLLVPQDNRPHHLNYCQGFMLGPHGPNISILDN